MVVNGTILVSSLSLLALHGTGAPQSGVRPAGAPTGTTVEPVAPQHVPSLHRLLPPQNVTLPSGEVVDFGAHEIWKPVCTTGTQVTREELERMAATHDRLVRRPSRVIDTTPSYRIGSFNIVFNVSGTPPAGATAAIAAAEAYMESFYSDPITITINCSFQPLSPGVLGGTSSSYGYVDYTTTRAQIVGDMDTNVVDDTIQAFLPSGSTCPVRYGSSSSVTNENRVFFTFANWKAADGAVAGADASMTFSTNFTFDYDPSNGITANTYSFQDIVIHETGHAMGFTSGGDFRSRDMEVLDLFRFQGTDGSGDYNPDTTAEFQVRPRLVRYNAPNDDHNSDLISVEYRMSDGSPYQMSHFREQTANIGLMDPALAPGQTFYPAFYSTADLAMFDAIGYDY
ncbi:MAG TPA: NF038122 family metalloprotease [Planctomycetota bacterium]